MLRFPSALRIYPAVEPVDMRKQYDGLWTAAQTQLIEDPKSGAVFCFSNKDRTRLKLLYWDGTGVWALALLISGVELKRGSLKPWCECDER